MQLQLSELFPLFDALQKHFGDPTLHSIYGAGQLHQPRVVLVFMNPTGRNVASQPDWNGLRSPWIGTKNVWKLLAQAKLISEGLFTRTQEYPSGGWTEAFAQEIYSDLANNGVYLTNLAKCTLSDARPLPNAVYREYLPFFQQELAALAPKSIVTFGNQVSSIVLGKPVSVSQYIGVEKELLEINGHTVPVYPTYYPVGQGMRNMPLAVARLAAILSSS